MGDTRCRWCGLWLLPILNGGDGWPFCSDACEVGSLNLRLERSNTCATRTMMSGAGDDCESSRPLAHSPSQEGTTR